MPRFVLLEHRWDGVHWDLMLETEERVLRTWAVNSPVESGIELSARGLNDHRLAYLDYEGEISGGRGTVRRIDSGEFFILDWLEDFVRVRLEGAQLLGPIELRRAVSGTLDDSGAVNDWVVRFGNFD